MKANRNPETGRFEPYTISVEVPFLSTEDSKRFIIEEFKKRIGEYIEDNYLDLTKYNDRKNYIKLTILT